MLVVDPHPSLDLAAFRTTFSGPIESTPSPSWLLELLSLEADAPVSRDENVRATVRDMLRHGGYKPTGRGKPASEYLVRAVGEGKLSSINAAVDVCNVVSLHSGLPISLVDLDRAKPPLKVAIADADARFVFNPAGQEIRIGGLVCLHDGEGPCANAVKDAQRTKTSPGTTATLSLVWGARALGEHTKRATAWYRSLLERLGARTEDVAQTAP
jgi:DNA/RNA-binding domain of Phe-tRNA-synthetase-like protein